MSDATPRPDKPPHGELELILLPYVVALVFPLGQLAANAWLLTSWTFILGVTVVVILGTGLIDLCTRLLLGSWTLRPFALCLLILAFFANGHVRHLYQIGRYTHLTFFCLAAIVVLVLPCVGLMLGWTTIRRVVRVLLLFSITFISIQTVTFVWCFWSQSAGPHPSRSLEAVDKELTVAEPLPDIYYIVFDAYAREDVLLDLYGYDNSTFLNQLRQRGFFVASRSCANYNQTALSLASSLNLDYVDEMVEGGDVRSRTVLYDLIRASRVDAILKAAGYRTVSVDTGYSFTRRTESDDFVMPIHGLTSEVEYGLARMVLSPLMTMGTDVLVRHHRDRVLATFAAVSETAKIPGPKFVFAHFLVPHPPFVFHADGSPQSPGYDYSIADGSGIVPELISEADYQKGYVEQLEFLNKKIIEMLDGLLADVHHPAVIILQADHGPGSRTNWYSVEDSDLRERLAILNAIRLPAGLEIGCYEEQSPVNTFRLLLNRLCGTRYDRLSDRAFFNLGETPLEHVEVTKTLEQLRSEGHALHASRSSTSPDSRHP